MNRVFDADRPIYIQLVERIKMMIASGEYGPGERVPAVRELAEQTAVNPNTLQRAMAELEREGLLISQRTTGRFITEDLTAIMELKKELAASHVKRFLEGMTAIGIPAEDAAKLIFEYREVGENGNP